MARRAVAGARPSRLGTAARTVTAMRDPEIDQLRARIANRDKNFRAAVWWACLAVMACSIFLAWKLL
jgi:hypothetical protein